MPTIRHIHQYYRIDKARRSPDPYIVYECRLADCTHYLPIASIIGKRCVCWDCKSPFFMDRQSLQIKPRCRTCRTERPYHKSKVKEFKDDLNPQGNVSDLLDRLLKGVK